VAARAGLILLLLLAGTGCGTPAPRARAGHPAAGHYASLNGIRMYYETYGKGPALVLLHGGAGSGAQFEKQIPALSRTFRLIVPDACAQGRSTDRPGPLSYDAMAEDVRALLDHLHVRRADVLGWSDGGVVALDLAMRHPERVDHVVTFGANFRADGLNAPDVAWNRTATAADFGPEMRAFYVSVAPDSSHYEAAMNKVIALWRDEPNWNPADLGRIRARTLVVAGEHDVVRRDHTEALARAIPGSVLWIVPAASHSVLQEQPAVVNPRILAFLSAAN
jgi:pimeloyl-ACP methyl ester carboxylesterase